MRENLATAARLFGLAITGEPILGWRLRSISAPAARGTEHCWLRVVSQDPQWAHGEAWTGALDANHIAGIPKPRVLDVAEWEEGRKQRAEIMTLMPGRPCSPTDVLHASIDLPPEWWTDLAQSLNSLASTPTTRTNADQNLVTIRITERFGDGPNTTVDEWETVHGDLHWSNITAPRFGLLDWELWGRGPRGTDAATLFCYSLLAPTVAATVRDRFHEVLDSPSGRVAQLYVVARLQRRIDGGDHLDLAEPLNDHVRDLLGP